MATKQPLEIKLRYTCAAYPPIGVSIDVQYLFGKDAKGFYYKTSEEKFYADLWFIKMLFTPVGKTWNDVEKLDT